MNIYIEGQLIKCSATFKDDEGNIQDPDDVKFIYQVNNDPPVELVYGTDEDLQRESSGIYFVKLDTTDSPGIWSYRFYSSPGAVQTANQARFRVERANPIMKEITP